MLKFTILFDLDGTLINSTGPILSSFRSAFKFHNLQSPNDENIISLIGLPLEIMFEKLGAPNELNSALVAQYKNAYKDVFLQGTTLLPAAKDALAKAREFADLGVVTTKTSHYAARILQNLGIAGYFSVLIGRDDVLEPKPSPEPILKALDALGKSKQNAFMIGDTPMDANSAKSAGVAAFGVSCGYCAEFELKKCCDAVFPDANSAVEFISQKDKNASR